MLQNSFIQEIVNLFSQGISFFLDFASRKKNTLSTNTLSTNNLYLFNFLFTTKVKDKENELKEMADQQKNLQKK